MANVDREMTFYWEHFISCIFKVVAKILLSIFHQTWPHAYGQSWILPKLPAKVDCRFRRFCCFYFSLFTI